MSVSDNEILSNNGFLKRDSNRTRLSLIIQLRWNDILSDSSLLNIILSIFQRYHSLYKLAQLVFHQINIFSRRKLVLLSRLHNLLRASSNPIRVLGNQMRVIDRGWMSF